MPQRFLVTTILALMLSACSLTPPYERPPLVMPEGWSSSPPSVSSQEAVPPFWVAFAPAELNRLLELALAQNLDLQAALHRIEQARAQAKVAGAGLLPTVDASGSLAGNFQESKTTPEVHGFATLNYELDLWGKNRNQAAAATYRVEASQYDREALRLVIVTDTVVFYSRILGFNDRIRIAERNLQNAEDVLRIIEARYREGSASGLEVSQQKVAVNTIRAALIVLTAQRASTLNALAILLAQPPQLFQAPQADFSALTVPAMTLTPPASLLANRPDIQSVEAELRAANADIGAARAAFFPSLNVGTDASVIAAGFGHPATWAFSLAADVLAPIFSGGRLEGNLETVTARQKELAAQYQQTVLIALQEVEDALVALKSSDQQVALFQQSVQAAQHAYTIAKARFDAGSIDFLTLLDTQRSLFQAEDDQVVATVNQVESFVQLRKALGS